MFINSTPHLDISVYYSLKSKFCKVEIKKPGKSAWLNSSFAGADFLVGKKPIVQIRIDPRHNTTPLTRKQYMHPAAGI